MKKIDKKKIAEDWNNRGFSCDIWVDSPGQVWEDFSHATDELFMLIEGEVELEIDGKSFRPAIGKEILIPARTLHSVRNVGSTTSWWFYGYKKT